MSENRFNTTAFANFSTKMDQNIALTNDHASLTLAKFLRECFSYRTAVVRFECTDNEAIPLAHCISIDFPELERENSLFLNDPFCSYILDNFSEQKFFAASDICPDYLNSTLIQTIDYKTPIFVGAFGYSNI